MPGIIPLMVYAPKQAGGCTSCPPFKSTLEISPRYRFCRLTQQWHEHASGTGTPQVTVKVIHKSCLFCGNALTRDLLPPAAMGLLPERGGGGSNLSRKSLAGRFNPLSRVWTIISASCHWGLRKHIEDNQNDDEGPPNPCLTPFLHQKQHVRKKSQGHTRDEAYD